LLTRLEQVDVQLDDLDRKRVECYGGEKQKKMVAKLPDQTTVYDAARGVVSIQTIAEYYKKHGKPTYPTFTTVYDPKTQSAKLVFWKQYVDEGYQAADLAARKPKPLPEFTSVYDKENKSAKLMLLDDYYKKHKPPTQAYAAVYDSATKSVKLVFWKTYLEEYLAKDLQARRAKKMPDCTTVYDPQTQEAKLVTWEAYLRTHKQPPAGHYTTVYDPKTQSCKLVTWRDYLEYHKANDMKKPQQQQQQQQQQPQKVCGGAAKKAIPEYTAVYDEETRTVKLQLWDEYIKANRPKWTQSYAAVYDPATQSVKAIYWRQYKEEYLKKEVKEAKKEVKTAKKAAKAVQTCPDQTVVYDPKTQTAQLQSLSQYLRTNKPKWTQSYAAVYDPATQSVKLVYWKQYLENYLAKDLEARKPKKLPEQTVVYDPKTKGLKLQLLSEYQKVSDT